MVSVPLKDGVFEKFKMELPYHSVIPLIGIYSPSPTKKKQMKSGPACTPLFAEALFTTASARSGSDLNVRDRCASLSARAPARVNPEGTRSGKSRLRRDKCHAIARIRAS